MLSNYVFYFPMEQRDSSKTTMVEWTVSRHKSLAVFLFFFMLFPRPWWQTCRLFKVIGAVPPAPLNPRWWPGRIPEWSCCSRPQQRQAHWGALTLSPWRWGDRLAAPQPHTFMVSDLASPRRCPCLTAVAQVAIAPTHSPKTIHSVFFPFLFCQCRHNSDWTSPPCPGNAALVRPVGNSSGMLD